MSIVIYTPEQAKLHVEERNAHYDKVKAAMRPDAVKASAKWLRDRQLHPTLLNSYKCWIADDQAEVDEATGRARPNHFYWDVAKKPVNDEWPRLAMEDLPAAEDFPEDANIGVQVGTPVEVDGVEYFLLDLDFDSRKHIPIWVELSRWLRLPNTVRYGHASKRNSHYLYFVDEPVHSKQGLVEIRCQTKTGTYMPYGNQTVFAGSVWTNGKDIEPVTLEDDSAPEIATISTELLMFAFHSMLAIGELVC